MGRELANLGTDIGGWSPNGEPPTVATSSNRPHRLHNAGFERRAQRLEER